MIKIKLKHVVFYMAIAIVLITIFLAPYLIFTVIEIKLWRRLPESITEMLITMKKDI